MGLYFYNARYYDPALGRFIQADTIVPSPANPQSLNRYAYTLNNPLRYTDPTGHIEENESEEANAIVAEMAQYGLDIVADWEHIAGGWVAGNWKLSELRRFKWAVLDFAGKFANSTAGFFKDSVLKGHRVPIVRSNTASQGHCEIATISGKLSMKMVLGNDMFQRPAGYRWLAKVGIVHELAHLWDYAHGNRYSNHMHSYANGEPAPTRYGETGGMIEEWAESVAAFVYADYTSKWLHDKNNFPHYQKEMQWASQYPAYNLPGLATRHKTYVNLAVNGMEGMAR
ncbi:MAG: RHS repeat-associated core domain-containing protein [Anaerolineae bacterium]